MTRFIRTVLGAICLLGLSACGSTFRLTASPGQTPGVTMGPFTSGSASSSSTITVQSLNGFSGSVALSGSCCRDLIRDEVVPLDGTGRFTWWLSSNTLSLQPGGSATSTLGLSIPMRPFTNLPSVPFGKYLVSVTGTSQGNTDQTVVGVTVLPDTEPSPACRSGVETLTMKLALEDEIKFAEATPRNPKFTIGVFAQTGPDVWGWTIEDDPTLMDGESTIVLDNAVSWQKELSTVGCSTNGKSIRAAGGKTAEFKMLQSEDQTLILRKPICAAIACLSTKWIDVAVFPDTSFWSVASRKKMTFRWAKD